VDFVTHAAVGALVGRVAAPTGLSNAGTRRYALAGALLAVTPDADHVLEWFGAEAYLLHHRGPTHSLAFVAASAALVLLAGREPRGRHALLVAAALLSHLALDVLTPYGTALLWPIADAWVALDVLPIFCPWLTALSLSAAVAGAALGRRLRWPRRLAAAALVALGAFVAFEAVVAGGARAAALPRAADDDPALPGARPAVLAVPSWREPSAAIACARTDRGRTYERLVVSAGEGARVVSRTPVFRRDGAAAPEDEAERVLAAVRASGADRLVRRFRLPAFETDGEDATVHDFQFDLVEEGLRPIRVVVPLDGGEPEVRQMHLGLQPILYVLVAALAYALSRRPAGWA
jgi:membrane-bound metal-dependent hydrolase YbcI (DUF457 family)